VSRKSPQENFAAIFLGVDLEARWSGDPAIRRSGDPFPCSGDPAALRKNRRDISLGVY
jgi:hypothetical protein